MTMDDYLGAKPISSPFGMFDCDALVDGVDRRRRSRPSMRRATCRTAPCASRRSACRSTSAWSGTRACSATSRTCSDQRLTCGPERRCGPSDVDVAELYDGFTFNCLSWIEALGFCEIGEAKDFLDGGKHIAIDGDLPREHPRRPAVSRPHPRHGTRPRGGHAAAWRRGPTPGPGCGHSRSEQRRPDPGRSHPVSGRRLSEGVHP